MPLIKLIREFRPHVMTTYDENGGYPHPDHIMCHKVTVVAFDAAGDPEQYPELGEPWQPLKLYYNSGWTRARMLALHEGMLAAGLESPYAEWLEKWADRDDRGDKITTRVECGEYFEVRDDALRAHATQVDPDGFWFQIPLELQQKVWPTEDFELARSLVDSPVPESDLFAGIRGAGATPAEQYAACLWACFAVNNFGDTRSGGLAGPMGLFVIVLLSIATVLLIRNMNKRLRRLPDSFPDAEQTQREAEIARLNADLDRPAPTSRPRSRPIDRSTDPGRRRGSRGQSRTT